MAGEHDDALSRVGDLIATVQLNSICCIVQARTYRTAAWWISPLTFLTGIYVPSPWQHAYEEQQLWTCDKRIRERTCPNAILRGASPFRYLIGKLLNDYPQCVDNGHRL